MSDHSAPLIAQPSTSPSNESAAHPLSPAEQRIEGAIKQVKAEIAQLEKELHVKYHHELLHTYNMRKDATQIMIGKIATLERATVAEISLKLGLDPTD